MTEMPARIISARSTLATRLARTGVLVALLAQQLAAPCLAEFPYPANPQPCSTDRDPATCIENTDYSKFAFLPATSPPALPNDYGGDNWKLTSATTGEPEIDNNPQELFGVKGASVDLAWQISTGRPDVLIAVLDSGIRWQDRLTDLVNKFHLNRHELPPPEGSTHAGDAWDRNQDGIFNVRDYLADADHVQDSRVSDQNGNSMIDPEDLIFLFSDGVDTDANGYIDDICGWDFFEDDNDALDEVRYGHGTGESEDSGAEANNGEGDVGTCPNCMLLPVRVGDSFVAEVNNFGQGVLFAVDSGALIVQEALGTLNNSAFAQTAVDYAYSHGVTVIASAADEESNHHNYPATYGHTVMVNSVTRFLSTAGLEQTPRSYLYLNGCTNYGGHMALSVPSSSCSSEATGKSSGMAGLLYSAAQNEIDRGRLLPYRAGGDDGPELALSANEVKQLLTKTADDINFDPNYETMTPFPGVQMSRRFPSISGWDQYFGYGRVNANSALRRLAELKIPPEADITQPDWFETLNPDEPLVVRADVAAKRSDSYSYRIEAAPGIQPAEGDFEAVAMGTASTPMEITADLATLIARMPNGVDGPALDASAAPDPDRFSATVRVVVTDQQGDVGEDRRVIAIHRDTDLQGGKPLRLGGDGVASPVIADIDGNGIDDVVLATSDGAVHVLRGDGLGDLPGWPVYSDPVDAHTDAPAFRTLAAPRATILGRPAVGDLDGDGHLDVVAADMRGNLYVWNEQGVLRDGFPVETLAVYSHSWRSERDAQTADGRVPDRSNRHDHDNRLGRSIGAGPVLANLDGSADGSLEIIAGAWDRHVYAWHRDGSPVLGWPVLLKDPAKVTAVDPVTNEVTLSSTANARIGTKIVTSPSIGDVDGDGALDVIAGVNEEYVENPNAVFNDLTINLYRAGGVLKSGNSRLYALGREGTMRGANPLERGWNPDAFLSGWPVKIATLTTELLPTVGTGINGSAALADLDGNGSAEIAIFSFLGPAYIFNGLGKSWLGDDLSRRVPRTLASQLGSGSNSIDAPAFPGLGGGVLAPFAGPGNGYHFLAPTAGLGKLIDNNIPAQQIPSENQFGAWQIASATGEPVNNGFVAAFPRVVNDLQFLTSPSVADINNDGSPEALEGSGVSDLHAFDIDGHEPAGWPKFTNGWMVATPATADIDGDGRLEVISTTREGRLFVWKTEGSECSFVPWRMNHHDAHSTGNTMTDARPPAPLSATATTTQPGGIVNLSLSAVPGDDLYCGAAAQLDIRYAASAITSEAAFAAATPLSVLVQPNTAGRNVSASVRLRAPVPFSPGEVHLAGRAIDDASNRSRLVTLGVVTLELEPSPTPTASASASLTATFTSSPTPTQSTLPSATQTTTPVPPTRTPSLTESPTRTPSAAVRVSDDDGCVIKDRPSDARALLLLAFAAAMLLLRRRHAGRSSRDEDFTTER